MRDAAMRYALCGCGQWAWAMGRGPWAMRLEPPVDMCPAVRHPTSNPCETSGGLLLWGNPCAIFFPRVVVQDSQDCKKDVSNGEAY